MRWVLSQPASISGSIPFVTRGPRIPPFIFDGYHPAVFEYSNGSFVFVAAHFRKPETRAEFNPFFDRGDTEQRRARLFSTPQNTGSRSRLGSPIAAASITPPTLSWPIRAASISSRIFSPGCFVNHRKPP